jgi:GxxExxY protein
LAYENSEIVQKEKSMNENELSKIALDICFNIHKTYGLGLFETVYEEIFCYECLKKELILNRQFPIPVVHENIKMGVGFRADVIIENKLLIEFKSIEKIADIHYKQVITYLKLTNLKLGLLINFNEVLLKNGIHRIVNNL